MIKNSKDIKIGYFYSYCGCLEDLLQIDNQEELREIKEDFDNDILTGIWKTKKDAIKDLPL